MNKFKEYLTEKIPTLSFSKKIARFASILCTEKIEQNDPK